MRRRRMAEVNKPPRFSARKAACLLTNLSKEACLYAGADWLKFICRPGCVEGSTSHFASLSTAPPEHCRCRLSSEGPG